jgi:hypothetical protein
MRDARDGRIRLRALAVIHFPMRLGEYDREDERDAGLALEQIGRAIAAGQKPPTGTVIVPFQERTEVKVSIDLSGPNGKMWELDMRYHRLPANYAAEVATVASSYAYYIENLAGEAGTATPAYSVAFKYEAEGDELEGLSGEPAKLYKGSARKGNLLYSQAVQVQDAGIELLQKLQTGAHMEIKSGQRK